MKPCPPALARLIALGLAAVTFSISAHAASYRWTILEVEQKSQNQVEETLAAIQNPQAFSLMVSTGIIKVAHVATIDCGPDGVGSVDQTYSVRYHQSLDSFGRPQQFTTRKVGIQATAKELTGNSVQLGLITTEFQGWVAFDSTKGFDGLQPIFTSGETNSVISFPEGTTTVMIGGLNRTEEKRLTGKASVTKKISRLFIVEKLMASTGGDALPTFPTTASSAPLFQQPTVVTPKAGSQ